MQKYTTVDEFLSDLDSAKKPQVLKLREYITGVAPSLNEHIKWNAPSYVLNGEDRITFNLMNKENLVKLVFHMGASRKENKKGAPVLGNKFPVIEWASDIRGNVTFKDLADVTAKADTVKQITKAWLALD